MSRLRSIDLLRVFGVLLMVGFHTQATFAERDVGVPDGGLFAAGYRGADLFFVISGFVILSSYGPEAGRPRRLSRYFVRRIVRIYPALAIASAAALVVYLSGFGGGAKRAKLDPGAIAASVLALPQHGFALVNTSWTLTYEVFFYALFGLVIVDRRLGAGALLAWQGACLVFAAPILHLVPPSTYLRSFSLDIGVGMACAWIARAPAIPRATLTWAIVASTGLASFLLAMWLDDQSALTGLLSGLGAGGLVLGSAQLERSGWRPGFEPLVRFGQASYAVYLIHFSVIALLVGVAVRLRLPVTDALALACAAVAIAVGIAFDRVVDRPIRRALLGHAPPVDGSRPIRWKSPGLP